MMARYMRVHQKLKLTIIAPRVSIPQTTFLLFYGYRGEAISVALFSPTFVIVWLLTVIARQTDSLAMSVVTMGLQNMGYNLTGMDTRDFWTKSQNVPLGMVLLLPKTCIIPVDLSNRGCFGRAFLKSSSARRWSIRGTLQGKAATRRCRRCRCFC
jgi:hypothetical protein